MYRLLKKKGAQVIIEYVALVAVIAAVSMAMLEYGKRVVNENIKLMGVEKE